MPGNNLWAGDVAQRHCTPLASAGHEFGPWYKKKKTSTAVPSAGDTHPGEVLTTTQQEKD